MDGGPADQIADFALLELEPFHLARLDLPRHLPRDPAQLSFKLSDSCLSGVSRYQSTESLITQLQLVGVESCISQLARQQVSARDHQLFCLCIARKLHHLHPIQQRARDVLDKVRCGHEENFRKVEWHTEIVVGERIVLPRV